MSDEPTERVRKAWDSQADKWFEHRDAMRVASRPKHEWLVALVRPRRTLIVSVPGTNDSASFAIDTRIQARMSMRRDGRAVDGGGLENHCTRKGTRGSNPFPSANLRSRLPTLA